MIQSKINSWRNKVCYLIGSTFDLSSLNLNYPTPRHVVNRPRGGARILIKILRFLVFSLTRLNERSNRLGINHCRFICCLFTRLSGDTISSAEVPLTMLDKLWPTYSYLSIYRWYRSDTDKANRGDRSGIINSSFEDMSSYFSLLRNINQKKFVTKRHIFNSHSFELNGIAFPYTTTLQN